MKYLVAASGLILAALAWWFIGNSPAASITQPLTADVIAKLEPELCSASPWTQLMTIISSRAALDNSKMDVEQLALIDVNGTDWHKVWILRLPAAYITQRTCDLGRQNWSDRGGGPLQVSQLYKLNFIVSENDTLPAVRANTEQSSRGFPVEVTLENTLWHPAKRHGSIGRFYGMYSGRTAECSEDESEVPGLVRFRPIDSRKQLGSLYCGSQSAKGTKWENRVYAKKVGDLAYNFIVDCIVNCTLKPTTMVGA